MKAFRHLLLPVFLCVAAFAAQGQDAPPPPGFPERGRAALRGELSPEERELRREEHRRRHEARRQMSPEERDQLRRDIRAAGREIYPRGPRWRKD